MKKTIWVDFNARLPDDSVDLATRGSQRSLDEAGVGSGDWVWVSDGEVRAGARIESQEGGLVARVAWETTETIPDREEPVSEAEIKRAVSELQTLFDVEDALEQELFPAQETETPPPQIK